MAEDNNNNRKWQLLNRLKTVVKKVTFIMNSNINRLLVSAFTKSAGFARRNRRQLSFGEALGLTAIMSSSDDDDDNDNNNNINNNTQYHDTGSSSKELNKARSFHVRNTMSFPEEEDIDKRAELFIENFYRQLRYQRQVSLKLRYTRGRSFGSSESSSITHSP